MKLKFAFLADVAQATLDGKITVIGGGLDYIYAPRFPALHQTLSLVIKLGVDPSELEREHILRIELISPLGATVMPPLRGKFTPKAATNEMPDWALSAQFAITINGLIFEMPGKHTFRISVDDQQLGTLNLLLAARPSDVPPPVPLEVSTEEES